MIVRLTLVLVLCAFVVACGSPEERAADYVEKAEALYQSGEFAEAELEARNAAQILPKDPRARVVLAKIALQEEDFQTAFGHLQIAIASDPDLLDARLLLGNLYYWGRANQQLAEEVEHAIRIAPQDPGVILLFARFLAAKGDEVAALAKLEESIRANPADHEAVLFKAALTADLEGTEAGVAVIDAYIGVVETTEALRQLRLRFLATAGLTDRFETELKAMIADFPDNQRYINQLFRYYADEGRLDDAEQALRSIADMDREDLNRQVGLVQFLASQRGAKAAETALREFIADSPDAPELQLALGQLLESEDRNEEAIVQYKLTIEIEPQGDASYAARNRIVSILIRQERSQEALEQIEQILAARPDNVDALLVRAAFNFASGQYDEVIVDARLVARKDPGSEEGLFLLSRAYEARGEMVLAEDAYRHVLKVNPANVNAAIALAALLVREGNTWEARQMLDTTLQLVADDVKAKVLESMVRVLLAEGNLATAESTARSIRELEPDTGRGDYQLGSVAVARGDDEAAIDAYRRSLQKSPDSLDTLQALIALELASDQEERAIANLLQFIAAHPEQPVARLLLGRAYLQTGDKVAAEREFKLLIVDQPGIPDAYLNLAALYGENTDARYTIIRQGFEANPADQRLGVLLGSEYHRHGRIDEAAAAYEEALRMNPRNDLVANNLVMLLLDNRTDEASLTRALEVARRFATSQQAVLLDTLGWAYYRNNDYLAAIRYLENAVEADGNIPELHYHLGMAYRESGDRTRAKEELDKAEAMGLTSSVEMDEAQAELEVQ